MFFSLMGNCSTTDPLLKRNLIPPFFSALQELLAVTPGLFWQIRQIRIINFNIADDDDGGGGGGGDNS